MEYNIFSLPETIDVHACHWILWNVVCNSNCLKEKSFVSIDDFSSVAESHSNLIWIDNQFRSSFHFDPKRNNLKRSSYSNFLLFLSEHNFSIYSASTTAASSIAASLYGMNWHRKSGISISSLLDLLKDLTGVEKVIKNDTPRNLWHFFHISISR